MEKLIVLTEKEKILGYVFWCPGCKEYHTFYLKESGFNGDFDNPTFSKSLLIKGLDNNIRCHLEIKNGVIKYFEESTHVFKGKEIPMKEI